MIRLRLSPATIDQVVVAYSPPSPLLARDTGLLSLRHPRQRRRFLRHKHLRPRALCRRARVTALAAPLDGPPPTHLGPPSRGAERSRSRTDECAPTAHGRCCARQRTRSAGTRACVGTAGDVPSCLLRVDRRLLR